jgi:hypothetical protein
MNQTEHISERLYNVTIELRSIAHAAIQAGEEEAVVDIVECERTLIALARRLVGKPVK